VATVVGAGFAGGSTAACGSAYSGAGLRNCRWASGGVAIGLLAVSIPFFVLGVRQTREHASSFQRFTVTAGATGATIGWTSTF
jgi:hypothetical protein